MHRRRRQRREIALEPAPQPRPDHEGEGDDEDIGRHREDAAGLADTTQVGEGDQRDEPHAERHAVAVQPRHGGGEGGHARRHAHGDGQNVVDQERGGRDQPWRGAEIGARNDVGAAARGIRVDGLLVGHGDHEENLFRRVSHGGERIGGKDGQGDGLRETLVASLRERHRLADDPTLQETRVHRPPKDGPSAWKTPRAPRMLRRGVSGSKQPAPLGKLCCHWGLLVARLAEASLVAAKPRLPRREP
jgi:hypothetical protein